MKLGQKITLTLGLVIIAGIFFWLTPSQATESTEQQPYKSTNWSTKFQVESKDPFGLHFFYRLMQRHIGNANKIKSCQSDSTWKQQKVETFIFVGETLVMNTTELNTVLKKVRTGSTLLISFRNMSSNVFDSLITSALFPTGLNIGYDYADRIQVKTESDPYTLHYQNGALTEAYDWHLFTSSLTTAEHLRVFSRVGSLANGIFVDIGKGKIILHTTPELFFNYQLIRKDGYECLLDLFTFIPKNQPVYMLDWEDDESIVSSENQHNYGGSSGRQTSEDSSTGPLDVVLKNPYLRTSILLIFGAFLLTILFRLNRQQPVIPLRKESEDYSKEFTETVAAIYMQKGRKNQFLSLQKQNFFDTIHKNFYIDLHNSHQRADKILHLQEKTGVDASRITHLINHLENNVSHEFSGKELLGLFREIQSFYKETGIHWNTAKVHEKVSRIAIPNNKNRSLLQILTGIFLFLSGFFALSKASALGILCWPPGIILFLNGGYSISTPKFIITQSNIKQHRFLLPNRLYNWNELNAVAMDAQKITLKISGKREIILPLVGILASEKEILISWFSNLTMNKYE
jgi:hypothetical protein